MKRVALVGYYGFNNTGDEAILYSIIRSMKQRDKNIEITVLSNNPEKTRKVYGVKARNRWKWHEVLSTIFNHDILVFGGGSLLQDVTSTRSLDYYLMIARVALLLRKKVYFMAQGIGPFKQKRSREKVVSLLNRVDVITVRDRDSKQELLDLGVTKPQMEVTADGVFSLYRNEVEKHPGEKVLARNGIEGERLSRLIGFSVRDWAELSNYKNTIAKLADALTGSGYQVVFVPFHFPDDVSCARDIAKLMVEEAVVMKEQYNTVEMLGIIDKMDLFIGMRMHSIVMASIMGVPTIGLSYDPKIEAAVHATGQTFGGRVENLDIDKLLYAAKELLMNRDAISESLLERVDKLRSRSRKNMDILVDMMGKKKNE